MYFEKFPKIFYDYEINGETQLKIVTDITRNVRIIKDVLANVTLYDEYDIRDGETPEIIAEKYYGNAMYHWVIMVVNEKYDAVDDFPLPIRELEKHIKEKYGDNVYEPHHFEDENGNIVNENYINVYGESVPTFPVSNYEYEERINERKRRIKLISPSILKTILKNFEDII